MLEFVENACNIQVETNDRLQYLRELDQKIASLHHLCLRYPAELLIEALFMRAHGTPLVKSARNAISKGLDKTDKPIKGAADEFRKSISQTPPLRDGVLLGLEKLRKTKATIIVATEGGLGRVRKHISDHGLTDFIDLSIETTKTRNFYARCRNLNKEAIPWCIGDQITRDITPAVEAGFKGLYFPGGFSPSWELKQNSLQTFITVDSYVDGVDYALNTKL